MIFLKMFNGMNKNVQSDAKVVIIWILNKLFCVFYYCCQIKDFDI